MAISVYRAQMAQVGFFDPPVHLRALLDRLVFHSFNEIYKLLDENPGEESQKISLMNVLHHIYLLSVKYRTAVKFTQYYRGSSALTKYYKDSQAYESYLASFADELFRLRAEIDVSMGSSYNIDQAIDMIVGGGISRLPRVFMPKRELDQDPRPFFRMLNDSVKVKLLGLQLPPGMKFRFNRGRAICTIDGAYKLFLTVLEADGPLTLTKLEILVPNVFVTGARSVEEFVWSSVSQMRTKGNDLRFRYPVSAEVVERIRQESNNILKTSKRPLLEIDRILRRLFSVLDFQRIRVEVMRSKTGGLIPLDFMLEPTRIIVTVWDDRFRFSITLVEKRNRIILQIRQNAIYDVYGKSFDEILGIFMRRIAIDNLSAFQRVLSQFDTHSQLDETGPVPTLTYNDCKFFIPPIKPDHGLIVCPERPELNPGLRDPSQWPRVAKYLASRAKSH